MSLNNEGKRKKPDKSLYPIMSPYGTISIHLFKCVLPTDILCICEGNLSINWNITNDQFSFRPTISEDGKDTENSQVSIKVNSMQTFIPSKRIK